MQEDEAVRAEYAALVSRRGTVEKSDLAKVFFCACIDADTSQCQRLLPPPLSTTELTRARKIREKYRGNAEMWRLVVEEATNEVFEPAGELSSSFLRWYEMAEELWTSMAHLRKTKAWLVLYAMVRQPDGMQLWRGVVGRSPDALLKRLQGFIDDHPNDELSAEELAVLLECVG